METSSPTSNPNLVKQITFEPEAPKTLEPSTKPVDTIANTDPLEPPVEMYEDKTGRPLIVDILDINQVYAKMDQRQEVQDINAYILAEIESRGYKSTKESYKSVMEEMKQAANITDLHEYDEQIRKLAIYAEALKKQKEAKRALESLNGPTV